MKQILSFALIVLVSLAACKKKNKEEDKPTTACNGKNFCMKVDGVQFSEDVKWRTINASRYRLIWELTQGTDYKNIEIDFYGNIATGTYTVKSGASSSGEAGFQYYIKEGGTVKDIQGQSGTVEITSVANDKLSGKFTLTANDGTNNIQITEGNFVDVPKQ